MLLPSDDFDWVANFVSGYQKCGYNAVVGRLNFTLESGEYDVLHLLWPEELTDWQVPTRGEVDAILRTLDRWAGRSRIIMSVSNLYPHRHPNEPEFRRLYTGFFERAEVIHHFSQASKRLVCSEYPSIAHRRHIVRLGFNYDRLRSQEIRNRDAARQKYGLSSGDIAFLVFGALRSWEEVRLLQRGFALARVPNKRLLLTARYAEIGPLWRQRWRRWTWRRWQRSKSVKSMPNRVHESDLPNLFDAADAIIVVRQTASVMTSGLPSLAMTLGRLVIAPNLGGIPEWLSNTGNILYDQNSAKDLARAIERSAAIDRELVGAENARIAAGWTWVNIVGTCLGALPAR